MTTSPSPTPQDEVLTESDLDELEVEAVNNEELSESLSEKILRAAAILRRHRSSPSSAWRDIKDAPRKGAVLLRIGETIPDLVDARVGTFIPGAEAEECGYREFAKYGGWLIWNSSGDYFVIDVNEPTGYAPLPEPPK